MNYNFRFCFLILVFSVFGSPLFCQSTVVTVPVARELGLRFTGFDDFNVIYKKEKAQDLNARHRFFQAFVGYNSNNSDFDLRLGYAYGRERVKPLVGGLSYYHGFEYSLFTSYSNQSSVGGSNRTSLTIIPAIGYIIGCKLNLSEKCYLSLEVIPSLSGNIGFTNGDFNPYQVGLDVNSYATAIGLMYRFVK